MHTLQAMGDQAALVRITEESAAWQFAERVRRAASPWLVDVVQAYASVAVFFDLEQTGYAAVAASLDPLAEVAEGDAGATTGTLHRIPCCYYFPLDLPRIADPDALLARLAETARAHDILRVKGYVEVAGKPMRMLVQGVGQRLRRDFDRPWAAGEARRSRLVVIGGKGLDRDAIETTLRA